MDFHRGRNAGVRQSKRMGDKWRRIFGQWGSRCWCCFCSSVWGLCAGRLKLLNTGAVKCMADVVLYVAFPCVIVQSFMRRFEPSMLRGLLAAGAAAFAIHAVSILVAHLVFRDKDEARRRVLRFCTVFSNAGYMALPLQSALLGETGVFYGAAYVAVFNLVLWSYGLVTMSGDKKGLSGKKLLLNPGVIGLAAGLLVFLLSIPVPEVLAAPIRHLAALNTPVPMLIIGFYLAQTNLSAALRDGRSYIAIGRGCGAAAACAVRYGAVRDAGAAAHFLRDRGERAGGGGLDHVRHQIRAGRPAERQPGVAFHAVFGRHHAADCGAGPVLGIGPVIKGRGRERTARRMHRKGSRLTACDKNR